MDCREVEWRGLVWSEWDGLDGSLGQLIIKQPYRIDILNDIMEGRMSPKLGK